VASLSILVAAAAWNQCKWQSGKWKVVGGKWQTRLKHCLPLLHTVCHVLSRSLSLSGHKQCDGNDTKSGLEMAATRMNWLTEMAQMVW